jgi:hypothetical protein
VLELEDQVAVELVLQELVEPMELQTLVVEVEEQVILEVMMVVEQVALVLLLQKNYVKHQEFGQCPNNLIRLVMVHGLHV